MTEFDAPDPGASANKAAYGPTTTRPGSNKSNRLLIGCLFGFAAALFLAFLGIAIIGMNMVTEEVQAALSENPVVSRHIGTVQSCEHSELRSMMDQRMSWFHYECVGETGTAKFEIHSEATGEDDAEEIVEGVLILPSGERHDLMAR